MSAKAYGREETKGTEMWIRCAQLFLSRRSMMRNQKKFVNFLFNFFLSEIEERSCWIFCFIRIHYLHVWKMEEDILWKYIFQKVIVKVFYNRFYLCPFWLSTTDKFVKQVRKYFGICTQLSRSLILFYVCGLCVCVCVIDQQLNTYTLEQSCMYEQS